MMSQKVPLGQLGAQQVGQNALGQMALGREVF